MISYEILLTADRPDRNADPSRAGSLALAFSPRPRQTLQRGAIPRRVPRDS